MSKLEDEARKIAESKGRYPTPDETLQYQEREMARQRQARELAEQQEKNRVDVLVNKIELGKQQLLDLFARTGLREKLIAAGKAFTIKPETYIKTDFYFTVLQIKPGVVYPKVGTHYLVDESLYLDKNIVDLVTNFMSIQLVLETIQHHGRWEGGQSGRIVGGGVQSLGPTFLMDEKGDFWGNLFDYDQTLKFFSFSRSKPIISHVDWKRSPDIFDKRILEELTKLP